MAESIRVTEADLRSAIRDPCYWTAGHPEREGFAAWVTDGFKALHGPEAKGGSVHVRAYTRHRDGKEEHVGAHMRGALPGGEKGGSEKLPLPDEKLQPDLLAPAQMLPWLLAKPPVIPQIRQPLMRRIPRQSGKDAADDTPSWARGRDNHRRVGEDPIQYARRLMDEKYGPGQWGQRGNPDQAKHLRQFQQLKKFGGRAFEGVVPFLPDDEPQA